MDDSTGGIEMRSEKQRSRSRAASVRIKKGRLQREQLDLKKVKADMRIRFTRALKTKFYGLIEEGYLESSRGFFMLLMTDYMLDDDMVNSKLDSFGHGGNARLNLFAYSCRPCIGCSATINGAVGSPR